MIIRFVVFAALILLAVSTVSSADAQIREHEAARVELSAKSRECKEQGGKVAGAMDCFRTCAMSARTVQNSTGLAAEAVAQMQAECDAKYRFAQTGTAAPVPAAPDYSGRAAALPAKAAYCRQAEARMGCPVDPSEPNWVKREQMCNTAKACGRCGDAGLVKRLSTTPARRDTMMLDSCEENHDAVKAWLDG